jgi:hypothetical protein
MGVSEVGWSFGSDWEAVEESFFTEVRIGLRLVAVSGHLLGLEQIGLILPDLLGPNLSGGW